MLTLTACGNAGSSSAGTSSQETVQENTQNDTQENTQESATNVSEEATAPDATEAPAEETPTPETIQRLVRETHYDADGTFSYQYVYEYNEAGKMVQKTTLNESGEVTGYNVFEYNENGQQTLNGKFSADGTPGIRLETVYNDAGIKIRFTHYRSDGSISTQKVYNDNGDILEDTINEEDGTLYEQILYTYNDNGRLIRQDYVNPEFTSFDYYEYVTDTPELVVRNYYSSEGNLYRQESFDGAGNLIKESFPSGSYSEYTYNEENQPLEISHYNADGSFNGGTRYTYNENHLLTRRTELAEDGSDLTWEEYTYDERSTLIKQFQNDIMDYGLVSLNCSYEYNENGKPIKKTELSSNDSVKGWVEYEYEEVVVSE